MAFGGIRDIREKAKEFTITDVRGLGKIWAKEMIVWGVTAASVGLFTAIFRIFEVWLAVVVSVIVFILAAIGNVALVGLPYISPKKPKLELKRFGTTTSDDISHLATDLRGLGFEVAEGEDFEKSTGAAAGISAVVWLVTDETAREFVRTGLRILLDYMLGISQKRGLTKVNIRFRAGGEDGTELNLSVGSDEPDTMRTTEKMVRELAQVGMKTALDDLPEGEKLAYYALPLGTDIYCRTPGPAGRYYFYDTKARQWKPKKPR